MDNIPCDRIIILRYLQENGTCNWTHPGKQNIKNASTGYGSFSMLWRAALKSLCDAQLVVASEKGFTITVSGEEILKGLI